MKNPTKKLEKKQLRFCSAARWWNGVWKDDARIQHDVHDLTDEKIWAQREELAKRSPTLKALL